MIAGVFPPLCQLRSPPFFFYDTDLRRGKCYAKVMDSDRGDSAAMCVGILSLDISRFQCCCTAGQGWGEPCMPCPEKNTSK